MSRFLRTPILVVGLLLAAAAGVVAHERLQVDEDTPLFWANPANVGIVINSDGSDDIPDGSHETALRMAIEDWNDVQGSDFQLVEDTDPAEQARTDWEADNIHLIYFDETNSSGYFGGGGIVAITPVWFFLNGRIVDADILFNGSEFMFTTSGHPGRFDVQDVGAHELGHLVGLDHSGWCGATMYPYVDAGVVLQRSLSLDEVAGLRDISPSSTWGTITGRVRRVSDSTGVSGAHVVAVGADGRPASSILAQEDGTFTLQGLPAGDYTVYADPLDGPVTQANVNHSPIDTDFETTFSGTTAVVPAGGEFALGDLDVGLDVSLSIGSNFDNYPLRAIQGQTVTHLVRGSGLNFGSTLSASDDDVTLSSVNWFGNSVSFQVTVPAGEPTGHVDLEVTNSSGHLNILPAALEITPPTPTVSVVSPSTGTSSGGTALTLTGTNFNPGARVVIGNQIYRDGEPGGCVVVDPTTITLTTLSTDEGTHDVVVVDSSGVDGRLPGAFLSAMLPTVTSVFPPAGSAVGGTEVVLRGEDFVDGLVVRIDGVLQSTAFDDSTRVRITTAGGIAGGPYTLEVENPGGGVTTSAFVYVAQADPVITAADPTTLHPDGGEVVTLTGANFPADAEVVFGADPDTGVGGVPAASVLVVNPGMIQVTTPAHASGGVSVLVRDASSSQADLLGGLSYSGGGGSGGGCAVVPTAPPASGPRGVLLGGWWIALLFGATLWMRARARRRAYAPL